MNWQDEQKKVATGVTGGQEWVASDMEKIYEDAFYQGIHEGSGKAMSFSKKEYFKTKKLQVTLQDRPIDIELAQYKRMFEAACSALGAVSDALGCDPDEGGSEPLLSAIEELKSNTQPKREWVGLTDEEIFETHKKVDSMQYLTFGKAIEAKLKELNT